MWLNTTAEWERRKHYLIRSLLKDITSLSPISESNEPPEQPISPNEVAVRRPYSPLPDLIIIKEPNRHDEPEEYYEALHKRVLIYYRKLFYDEHFSDTSELDDSNRSDSNDEEDRIKNSTATHQYSSTSDKFREDFELSPNKSGTPLQEEEDAYEGESNQNTLASNSPSSSNTQNSSIASERCDNNIIITQASVHCESYEEIDFSTGYTTKPRVLRAKSDEEPSLNKTANDAMELNIRNDDKPSESVHSTNAFEDNDVEHARSSTHGLSITAAEEFEDDDGEHARSSTKGHNITTSNASGLNIDIGDGQSENDHVTEEFEDNDGEHARSSTQAHNVTASDASVLIMESGDERSEKDYVTEEIEVIDEETARFSKKEEILRKTQNNPASDTSSSPDEPEIMRRRKTGNGSPESMRDLILNVARRSSEVSQTEKSAEIDPYREMEEAEISSPHLSNATGSASKTSSSRKRKIEDNSDNCDWEEIKNSFFKNRPRIFNLSY